MSEARHDRVRKKYHILVEGEGIPPPIKSFKEMKFPAGALGGEPGRVGGRILLGNTCQRAKLLGLWRSVLAGSQLKLTVVAVSPGCWPKGCLSLMEELLLGPELEGNLGKTSGCEQTCPLFPDSHPEGPEKKRDSAANAHPDPGHSHHVSALCPSWSGGWVLPTAHPML